MSLCVLLLLVLLRGVVLETFTVPSSSMTPTLRPGDRVAVWKPGSGDVRRGQVVVFDATAAFEVGSAPTGLRGRLAGLGDAVGIRFGQTDYVKRVVGVGGDRVTQGADGVLRVNGRLTDERYLGSRHTPGEPYDVRVPRGSVFVLGDDRADSDDSRAHLGSPGGGMVPVDDIVGRVTFRYWPPSSWGTLT